MSAKKLKQSRQGRERHDRGDRRDDGRVARLRFQEARVHAAKYEDDTRSFQNGITGKWSMGHMKV